MTDPFSRPGAVDLSALKANDPSGGAQAGQAGGAAQAPSGAYTVELTEANFQAEMQQSLQVPIVVSFWSQQSQPSQQLNATLQKLADEFAGRFLFGKVDIDANPQIAQAVGIEAAPLVAVVLGGQLAPLAQNAVPEDELRRVLNQVIETAVANGMTGRAEPRQPAGPQQAGEEGAGEQAADSKYAEAEAALSSGDLDGAIAAYERILNEEPGDEGARVGLARARLVSRTRDVDAAAAREAAAAAPNDVDAQIKVADIDLVGGHVDDAFDRLVQTVSRTAGAERDRARNHLVELFEIVGNEDPRVLTFRTRLASALF